MLRVLRRLLTLDFGLVALGLPHHKSCRLSVQRIGWIWIAKKLWKEDLEDVDHVVHWRPRLVDHIQTDAAGEFVDVWVEDAVDETDAWALVGVLIRQFDMDLPEAAEEWCYPCCKRLESWLHVGTSIAHSLLVP